MRKASPTVGEGLAFKKAIVVKGFTRATSHTPLHQTHTQLELDLVLFSQVLTATITGIGGAAGAP